jgi:GrpB-like predicted nucleotidyltransferase (UPF0157 family)
MKIKLEPYNPEWPETFHAIQKDLGNHLAFLDPMIEHVGSTSIPGMTAKPIIDILVGVHDEADLDKTVEPLIDKGYIFYEKYNSVMPYRRYFVKLRSRPENITVPKVYYTGEKPFDEIDDYKQAHIHVLAAGTYHWKRHVAFRDYLRRHPDLARAYEELKIRLSALEWQSGNHYNSGKEDFILETQEKALEWYSESDDK